MAEQGSETETIIFLGTGGARVMVATQLLASGGMWFNLGGTEILVDPGPGCIVQSTKRKLRPDKLSAIIISHHHLDHSGDANIMVEAMTSGGFKPKGRLFAPASALGEKEPVIYSYLHKYLDSIEALEEGQSYTVGNIKFSTPVRHIHPVETYGLVFQDGEHTISYIADTRYFDRLIESYKGELLIMNVVFTEPRPGIDHLSIPDVKALVTAIKPKAAIMTHFGMTMWRAHPWEVAQKLTEETGIRVIAARDGMRFHLSELDKDT